MDGPRLQTRSPGWRYGFAVLAVGIAAAYAYAAANRDRYADFFEADGSLAGPGYSEDEAAGLPEQYRLPGVVIKSATPSVTAAT